MNIDGSVRWGGGDYSLKQQVAPVVDLNGVLTMQSRTPVYTAETKTPQYTHRKA